MIPYFLLRKVGITISWLVRNVPGRLICSELFAVCALCIPIEFRKQTSLVTPDTLYTTDLMYTVYEGSYTVYIKSVVYRVSGVTRLVCILLI